MCYLGGGIVIQRNLPSDFKTQIDCWSLMRHILRILLLPQKNKKQKQTTFNCFQSYTGSNFGTAILRQLPVWCGIKDTSNPVIL